MPIKKMTPKDYATKTDEELILLFRTNQEQEIMDYLLDKYKNLVRKHANVLFLIGGDTDDLIQEGMIGLFKAIMDFNSQKEVSFYHFAELCVTRQMYSAIEASNRKKHAPLNSYVSLSASQEGTKEQKNDWMESLLLSSSQVNPEQIMIDNENIQFMKEQLDKTLSGFEKLVLQSYLSGNGYMQIAQEFGKSPKSIDNALQRIRKKVSQIH